MKVFLCNIINHFKNLFSLEENESYRDYNLCFGSYKLADNLIGKKQTLDLTNIFEIVLCLEYSLPNEKWVFH